MGLKGVLFKKEQVGRKVMTSRKDQHGSNYTTVRNHTEAKHLGYSKWSTKGDKHSRRVTISLYHFHKIAQRHHTRDLSNL